MKHLADNHQCWIRPARLLGVYGFVVVWALILLVRLADLQIYQGERFLRQARSQQQGFTIVRGKRGEILDRNLETLAISVQVYDLTAEPELIDDPASTAAALAPIIALPAGEILPRLQLERRSVTLSRGVAPRQAEEIRRLGLTGVFLRREPRRFYPDSRLAAQVLGFVGRDGEGLSGVEYRWNDQLQGRQDRVSLQLDARRQSYASEAGKEGRNGSTLVLNLHSAVQHVAEAVLEETVLNSRASDGSVIVMDPHTGEILAMASYPGFDLNRFQEYPEEAYRNRAILEAFEPGSTMKVVSLAAVLQEGLVEPGEAIDCRVGTLRLAGKVYREAYRSFEKLTFNEIIAKSSNVGTIKLVMRLGPERLHRYLEAFGFGEKTGIDLPGEQDGLLRPTSQWSKISIGALAIGQELSATPLQVLRSVAVIANGGFLVTPQVIRRVLNGKGELVKAAPQRRRILEPRIAGQMKLALAGVVTRGTGRSAALSGFSSAGKTGTAQKFVDGRYSDSRYVASYVGFAPLENPRLAAIVVINEPQGRYFGGHVAGPAFKEIMEQALYILRVPPDQARPVASPPHSLAELTGLESVTLSEEPLAAEELEETVLTLMDEQRDPHKPGFLQVDTDLVPTPDFQGKSLRQVARECAGRGLRLKVSGSGRAVAQRPAAGRRVRRGTVCEVFFSNRGPENRATQPTDRQGASTEGLARSDSDG